MVYEFKLMTPQELASLLDIINLIHSMIKILLSIMLPIFSLLVREGIKELSIPPKIKCLGIAAAFNNPEYFPDVEIEIVSDGDSTIVKAHSYILATRSPVLRKILLDNKGKTLVTLSCEGDPTLLVALLRYHFPVLISYPL